MSVDTAIRQGMNEAISASVERQFEGWMAGYTDAMLYQLAYTQVFLLGGFGTNPDDFSVGEGSTWRIEAIGEEDDGGMFTAERALLSRDEAGNSWWYLKYTPDNHEGEDLSFEYEVLVDRDLQAREMYLRDNENQEIRHHVFDYTAADIEEAEASEAALQEEGYATTPIFLQNREQYHTEHVSVQVGSGLYDADLLVYTLEDPETNDAFEYRWWVSKDVPGELVKFEYGDMTQGGGMLRGELLDLRRDYTHRLASFD